MGKIPVYIIDDDIHNLSSRHTTELFCQGYFEIIKPRIEPRAFSNCNSSLSNNNKLEYNKVYQCLKRAHKKYPDEHVLIIKNTSTSHFSSEKLAELINLGKDDKIDLLYLCRWQDKCNISFGKKWVADDKILISETQSPRGVQAIVFSPQGRCKVLELLRRKNIYNSLSEELRSSIFNGNLKANCFTPNLVNYNFAIVNDNQDYKKFQLCERIRHIDDRSKKSSYIVPAIILFILIILLLAVYYAYRNNYLDKYKSKFVEYWK
jgi:hypothetical protein